MTVHLVGAGPGDPELLTVKAVRLIGEAEVIVHDYLSNDSILELAKPGTEFIDVGKKPGNPTPQELINALLVHLGAQGKNIVRLKGGDPFIFGRGGEEAEACDAAGVPVEVVPGVSAAMACAAQAQMPLTHRDSASAVTFVAGQCKGLTDQDWSGLAGHGRTLVIYMGMQRIAAITAALVEAGMAATPAAVIEHGTTARERSVTGCVENIAAKAAAAGLGSPALIVIGAVVDLAAQQAQTLPLRRSA